MNEKPIIFATPMVQALLNGRKTMTRRVIKPQPICDSADIAPDCRKASVKYYAQHNILVCAACGDAIEYDEGKLTLPRYKHGDTLYVKETYALVNGRDCGTDDFYVYKTDEEYAKQFVAKWKPAIHMPRKVARLFLRVTDVRVERVQDITEADAKAEGIRSYWVHCEYGGEWHESNFMFVGVDTNTHPTRKEAFAELWDSLNTKPGCGWDSSPWVWVYSFERIDKK
jgi:hypothetical protein